MADPIRVAGVILHQGDRVLLQHRDDKPDIVWPGAWAIFGGHMEPGETPEEAARREMFEELGLQQLPSLKLVHHGSDGQRERFIFAAPLTVPVEELTLKEGQGMALLGPDDLDRYTVIPRHREILREFFATRSH